VETVRAVFEAWNAGDMDAVRELYDPDVFVGREAVMRQWEVQREAFNADKLEAISDFVDAADRLS
jgi:predicted lipid-binding transport protein (Tim44 family)